MSGVVIAVAEMADLESIAIAFDAYRQFYRQEANLKGARVFIQERLETGTSTILLAKEGDRLLGFTQLYPSFSSVSMGPTWILNDLFVFKSDRRRGVARALMAAAKAFGRESGAIALSLATEKTNASAQALYRSLDYTQEDAFLYFDLSLIHEH